MNPPPQSRSERGEPVVDTARPIAISHIVHTLRSYAPAILLTVLGVALLYTIGALAYYLTGPTERVTTLPFRLDFEGASAGTYPNGTKFSPTEIVGSQVLLRVYNANKLDRFLSFPDFSRSLFVLESNPTMERLATEYQSRLSDPKLTSVERERIQKEFDLKRASIAKNEYAISYARDITGKHLPEPLVRKVLGDVLTMWADMATKEQHVSKYEVSILSPRFLDPTPVEQADTVVAVQVLRSKTLRVMMNISELLGLPAARLARTKDNLTLVELRLRLDEIMRFRLEPLVPLAVTSGELANPGRTISFMETQLAHDQRQLAARQAGLTAIREALMIYFTNQMGHNSSVAETPGGPETSPMQPSNDRSTVTPQLSESFIDRLVTLTSNAADIAYRQQMIDNYRKAAQDVIPLQEAVAYDTHVLQELRAARGGGASDAVVRAQIEAIRVDVRSMIGTIRELHEVVSANLNPATELFTTTSPPYTRVNRSRSLPRLMLFGIFVVLGSLLAACLGALLHRRVRDEEAEEGYVQEEQTA
jgi:hypothetical protein